MKTISYALFDSRYTTDEDSSICYSVCETLEEARKEKEEDFPDAVIVRETLQLIGNNKREVIKSEIV